MSVVETQLFTQPREVSVYLYELLLEHAGPLGIRYVAYNERLRPEYPSVVVTPGIKTKVLHATHTFNIGLEVGLLVYHANLNTRTSTRTQEDLQLVEDIETVIEQGGMNMEGHVIFAFVREAVPGTLLRATGEQVIGTRMVIDVLSQARFG